jgi:chemotaxis protein MotB
MNNNKNGETNFWISYADLMAGLLFVFILLIGAIIAKYSLLQSESKLLEVTLKKEKIALEENKKELKQKKLKIINTVTDLKNTRKDLSKVKNEYKEKIDELKSSLVENEKLKIVIENKTEKIEKQDGELEENKNKLVLFSSTKKELEKSLKNLSKEKITLLSNIDKLDKSLKNKDEKIVLFKNEKKSFEEKIEDLNKKKDSLASNLDKLQSTLKIKDEELNRLVEDVLVKQKLISTFKEKNSNLDDELKVLAVKLESTENKHAILSKDLQSTKSKIKNLTGIKIKVISLLKNKLGKNMQIDPKNGSIRLSSNILFDEGEFELKTSSKDSLKNAIYDYFLAILENKEINQHIDKVIIEGHTNSKGTFLYNLELSQKRAYSVMDFLLSQDFKNKEKLKELVVASGRSFLDPIYDKNGNEDTNESRRIEIKFSLKNEEAIKEIANILE